MKTNLETACGGIIRVPDGNLKRLRLRPEFFSLIKEAASMIKLPTDGTNLKETIDLGRILGRTGRISTERVGYDESAFFVWRSNHKGPSRIVFDQLGPEVSTMAIIGFPSRERKSGKVQPGRYIFTTAWIGTADAEQEPWEPRIRNDNNALQMSIEYWCTHAFVYDPATMKEYFKSTWKKVLENRF